MAVTVLFVCHAGRGTGLGHLTRSLSAARLLGDAGGFEVCFLVQGDTVQRDDLGHYSHRFIPFEGDLNEAVSNEVQHAGAGVVVFDLNSGIALSGIEVLLQELHYLGCKLVSIDPMPTAYPHLDLVYVPAFHFTPPEGIDASKIWFGWDHYLLNVSPGAGSWKSGRSVLVLSGGSDATGLGKTWPAQLDECLPDGALVHWVVGPYAEAPSIPSQSRHEFVLHKGLSGLDSLIGEVNYAVTVYGVSFFELLYCGIPTVVFSPYGSKDDLELAAIASEDVALVARDEHDATVMTAQLMNDNALAETISRDAKRRFLSDKPHPFVTALQSL